MFHELWVGEQPSLPFKHKVMGVVQKHLMMKALKRWAPDCLHTSNRLYQFVLQQNGYQAGRLPIFGNISIATPGDSAMPEADCGTDERILLFPPEFNIMENAPPLEPV